MKLHVQKVKIHFCDGHRYWCAMTKAYSRVGPTPSAPSARGARCRSWARSTSGSTARPAAPTRHWTTPRP